MDEHKNYLLYIAEIQKHPLLTFEEELDLAYRIKNSDTKARQRLINCNLRLVVSIAHKFKNAHMGLMDLIQEGNIGLITAVDKYSKQFNVRFSTYACCWIFQSINRGLLHKKRTIKLPYRKEELLSKIYKVKLELTERLGHEANCQEIACFLSMPIDEVYATLSYAFSVISIDTVINTEKTLSIKDLLYDVRYNPEEQVLLDSRRTFSHTLLKTLPYREQYVLYHRYNFDYREKPKTLQQISTHLGVSTETVRQVEIRALKQLQQRRTDFIEYSV